MKKISYAFLILSLILLSIVMTSAYVFNEFIVPSSPGDYYNADFTLNVSSDRLANCTFRTNSSNVQNSDALMEGIGTYYHSANIDVSGMEDGSITIYINCSNSTVPIDSTQNETYIIVDRTAPSVYGSDTNDADNIVRNTTIIYITVTVTDANSISSVTVNGSSMAQSGDTWWNLTRVSRLCPGIEGNCTLTFIATDMVGNVNDSHTLTLFVNSTVSSGGAPGGGSGGSGGFGSNDTDGIVRSTDSLNITLISSDSSIASVTLNGTAMVKSGNSWSTINTTSQFCPSVQNGLCALTYIAYDDEDNEVDSHTITFTVDDIKPSVTNPATDTEGYALADQLVNFSVVVTDANIANVTLNGTDLVQAGNLWSTINRSSDFGCDSDGACVLTYRAIDKAGNINGTTQIAIYVDETGPIVEITSPEENDSISGFFNLQGIYTDPGAGVYNVTYYYYDGGLSRIGVSSASPFNITWNTTGLIEGYYNITAVATDRLSFSSNDSVVDVLVDNTAPVNLSFVISNATLISGDELEANCSADDAWDASVTIAITDEGTSSAGTFTAICTATDDAGNSVAESQNYTVTAASQPRRRNGGGGGGGSYAGISPAQTVSWTSSNEEEPQKTVFTKEGLMISEITLLPNQKLSEGWIKAEALKDRPQQTRERTGKVFKYLRITTSVNGSQLDSARIAFKVPKSWLADNDVPIKNIVLIRFVEDRWEELVTDVLGEDMTYVFYESKTRGFSYFAIAEKTTGDIDTGHAEETGSPNAPPIPIDQIPPEEGSEEIVAKSPDDDSVSVMNGDKLGSIEKGSNPLFASLLVLALITVLSTAILYYARRKK